MLLDIFFYKPFPYNLHRCMNRLFLFLWSDSFPFGKIKADTLHNDIESCTCKTLEWHIYDALRGNNASVITSFFPPFLNVCLFFRQCLISITKLITYGAWCVARHPRVHTRKLYCCIFWCYIEHWLILLVFVIFHLQ